MIATNVFLPQSQEEHLIFWIPWTSGNTLSCPICYSLWGAGREARILHSGKGLSPSTAVNHLSLWCRLLIKACHTRPGACLHEFTQGVIPLIALLYKITQSLFLIKRLSSLILCIYALKKKKVFLSKCSSFHSGRHRWVVYTTEMNGKNTFWEVDGSMVPPDW